MIAIELIERAADEMRATPDDEMGHKAITLTLEMLRAAASVAAASGCDSIAWSKACSEAWAQGETFAEAVHAAGEGDPCD